MHEATFVDELTDGAGMGDKFAVADVYFFLVKIHRSHLEQRRRERDLSASLSGLMHFLPADELEFNGLPLDTSNVIQFLNGNQGVIYSGRRAIQIALRLDASAERFATNEIAAGYLAQRGGEPMSGEELAEMAAAWAANRRTNAIGALNEFVEFIPFDQDPSKLQLVEGREYQTKELSRLMDIPAYLLAIDQSGMTYANAQQARQDLLLFGARPLLHAIEERLSMDDVLPRGRHTQFDLDEYVGEYAPDMAEPVMREPAANPLSDTNNLE